MNILKVLFCCIPFIGFKICTYSDDDNSQLTINIFYRWLSLIISIIWVWVFLIGLIYNYL